jgi:hypothetical protein
MLFQLRMYRVRPGALDEWIEEWREHVLPLRRAKDFTVIGPWIRREEDLFVWLVGHDDLDSANEAYYSSPERASIDPDPARHLVSTETWTVEDV